MDYFTLTSSCNQPEAVVDLWISQYKTASTLATCSTALYGFNVALAISCVRLLLTHKDLNNSRRKQTVTCLYITTMIAFASDAVVYDNMTLDGGVIDSLINPENPQKLLCAIFSPRMPVSLPLAVWGADAILVRIISSSSIQLNEWLTSNIKIYRCIVLYQLAPYAEKSCCTFF